MKYWYINKIESFLLLAGLCIYSLNKLFLKSMINHWLIQSYLNDVMAGICFLVISQNLMYHWLKRGMKIGESIILIYLAGCYWEFIAPRYIITAVSDKKDLIAYLVGGLIVILVRYLNKKRENKR